MIELFQFQEQAAASIATRVSDYLDDSVTVGTKKNPHDVPFFQALSAITGAGKTVILASAVAQIADTMPVAPVILWLSKGKVVVQQTFANLSEGGKYHHLLDGMKVQLLSDYSATEVEESSQSLVFFATVGTFNQKEKEDGSLRIHKSDVDNLEASIWEALTLRLNDEGFQRPLIVVYDEAHNLSEQQTELLLELGPNGFLLASATMRLPARIGEEVDHLRRAGWTDDTLITRVRTSDVVEAALVKESILLKGYNSPMEETVANLLEDMDEVRQNAVDLGLNFRPKAIYVCNTNVVADTPTISDSPKQPFGQRQAPPILIWRYLTEQMGVDPETIAVYANLKTDREFPMPSEFTLFGNGDRAYDDFAAGDYEHIIFNLTLQEGWDDPEVYFAYVDKSMESTVQISQVVGRVLRQPGATHYSVDQLNTAHLYVRVDKNSTFNGVIDDLKAELGAGAGGIRIVVSAPGKPRPLAYAARQQLTVPETGLDPQIARAEVEKLLETFTDYREGGKNTIGEGSRRVFRQKVGLDATDAEWETFEQASQASARWVFHREVQRQFRKALGVVHLANPKLDAIVGIGSPAHVHTCNLANQVVEAYVKGVRIVQRKSNPYVVGTVLASPDEIQVFNNALHEGYAGLNPLERTFAESLDKTGLPWARNLPRVGYGIPLISVGPTQSFYPDFLVWTDQRVICVDTKGQHLIRETAARKLLRIKPASEGKRLDVQFVSAGRWSVELEQKDSEGFTYWGLGDDGKIESHHCPDMDELLDVLVLDGD